MDEFLRSGQVDLSDLVKAAGASIVTIQVGTCQLWERLPSTLFSVFWFSKKIDSAHLERFPRYNLTNMAHAESTRDTQS